MREEHGAELGDTEQPCVAGAFAGLVATALVVSLVMGRSLPPAARRSYCFGLRRMLGKAGGMSLHLRFGQEDLLRCRFAISPLWETQEAIRTLRRPDRHGYHLPWLRRIRDAARGSTWRRSGC